MKITKTEEIDLYYITTKEDLKETVSFLKDKDLLSIDTETFVDVTKLNSSALDPHSSIVSLIQVNSIDNKIPFVIDLLEIGIEEARIFDKEILQNKNIRKVIQNAPFDMKQLYKTFGTWPQNVWCTKVLLQSLGICTGMKASIFRGHSLKDWAKDYFDIDLDKSEATSQWGARPLTESQLAYSALDAGAPKDSGINCLLLEGYLLFKKQLDELNQQVAYEADQQAMIISAKMEYEGMYINSDILSKIYKYATEQTNTHRDFIVKELGFTLYYDMELNDDGEFESVVVIPDKIKKLLNNNKGLVSYINKHMFSRGEAQLSSLQADEVKNYLDAIEAEVDPDNKVQLDEEYLEFKYESIKLIKSLLKYKKYNKLMSECEKYFKVINPNTDKVHAGFNSVGTGTGRMSSSGNLNLQQCSNTQVVIQLSKEMF